MPKSRPEFLVLAIDIGTSSTRAALFDDRGRRLPDTTAAENYAISYGEDGKAELSPFDLLRAVKRVRDLTLRQYRASGRSRLSVRAVGGSALWHGLLGL